MIARFPGFGRTIWQSRIVGMEASGTLVDMLGIGIRAHRARSERTVDPVLGASKRD